MAFENKTKKITYRKIEIVAKFFKTYTYAVNLVTENMGLETPENLTWPNSFGTGQISWVIPIIKEKWGYKPPKITQ